MNQSIYVIYDRVAKVHYTPFFQTNDEHATRSFISMARDPNTPMHANPHDFDLFHVGFYDSDQGAIEGNVYELVQRGAGSEVTETTNLKKVAG